jgi:hypothetical protein
MQIIIHLFALTAIKRYLFTYIQQLAFFFNKNELFISILKSFRLLLYVN